MRRAEIWPVIAALLMCSILNGQGKIILTSGGLAAEALFKKLAGPDARVVFIPTAQSSLRTPSGLVWDPDQQEHRAEFEKEIREHFRLKEIMILHTRDRNLADSEAFVAPLRSADAVWISGGNADRLAKAYGGTRVVTELKALHLRGGIIVGESAGAMILGSYIVRGNPNDAGFGLLPQVVINPHLTAAKREKVLVKVVDREPQLLGLGIDDDTGLLVDGDIAEVFGTSRVAIYDHRKHNGYWYYYLKRGDRFDLKTRVRLR